MPRWLRRTALVLLTVTLLLALAAGVVWWALRTEWFAHALQARVISSLQDATGGRVEIGRFTFDSGALRVHVERLIIHGLEPAGAPPLLSVDSADIELKILSLWRRAIDIQSVTFVRPQVALSVNADGSTNLPAPKRRQNAGIVQELLNLKIGRLLLTDGSVRLNNHSVPLELEAGNLGLLLKYNYAGPSYVAALQSDVKNFAVAGSNVALFHLAAHARVFQDSAELEDISLTTPGAATQLTLSGQLHNFASLGAEAKVTGSISMDEVTRWTGLHNNLRGGRAKVNGTLQYVSANPGAWAFNGNVQAQGLDLTVPGLSLRGIAAVAGFEARRSGLLLHHAQVSAEGAHFAGEGEIEAYKNLKLNGRFSLVTLEAVGRRFTNQPFPWSGIASGVAHVTARLRRQSDLAISAEADIVSAPGAVPTSGSVSFTYQAQANSLAFTNSYLQLPHTNLRFDGPLNGALTLKADTSDTRDIEAVLPILRIKLDPALRPHFSGGQARFDGTLQDLTGRASIQGTLSATRFKIRETAWESLEADLAYSPERLSVSRFALKESGANASGDASAELANWSVEPNLPAHANVRFANLDIVKTAALFNLPAPAIQGIASGRLEFHGSIGAPRGAGNFQIDSLDAYGEQLNRVVFSAALSNGAVQITGGKVQAQSAIMAFSGAYRRTAPDWSTGDVQIEADTNGFPLASSSTFRRVAPSLNAFAELHLQSRGKFNGHAFEPQSLRGSAEFSRVTVEGRNLGGASLRATTEGNFINFTYLGALRATKFHGSAQAQLAAGTPIRGSVQLERLDLAALKNVFTDAGLALPVSGFLEGGLSFDGLLEEPKKMRAQASVSRLEIAPLKTQAGIVLSNNQPILVELSDGVLHIDRFEMDGRDTGVKISGTVPLAAGAPMAVKAVGNADLALFMLFDPNVRSAGKSELAVNIGGTPAAPNVSGSLDIRGGSFFLSDLPNGLSDVEGTVLFSRNRATIQKMTAHSGGGDIMLAGTLSFSAGSPLVYHLEAVARNVRVRYANSISVTANSDLRLSGASSSGILSGTLTVSRVVFTPNADAGSLLAAVGSSPSSPADQGDFISGLHLDITVESAPDLQVSTNLSRDVEAEIQLSLRGTPEHPIVLGNIIANQGDLKIFGTRFSLNRGEVSFVNTVRIEPVLDLDLETQARGVTVDITVSGTPSKLNFNYRSDPPLQPRDIIALLTVGRAPDAGATSNAQSGSDVSALKSGVNSVLGQAISPVSNRLSKLFGITNIKIDPFVQGITNTPQARLSVEQQISRNVTVTYVTNLSQTSEQIFRFEWALSRQFSVVALRDDNGEFGIDFQYKKRFK